MLRLTLTLLSLLIVGSYAGCETMTLQLYDSVSYGIVLFQSVTPSTSMTLMDASLRLFPGDSWDGIDIDDVAPTVSVSATVTNVDVFCTGLTFEIWGLSGNDVVMFSSSPVFTGLDRIATTSRSNFVLPDGSSYLNGWYFWVQFNTNGISGCQYTIGSQTQLSSFSMTACT